MNPLDGPRRKLARASEHIQTFKEVVNRWYDSKPLRVVFKDFNAEKTFYIYRIEISPIPIDFGIVVGDIFHNLRSALDYLAWQLALLIPENIRPVGWENEVEFPIFLSLEKNWIRNRYERIMSHFPEDARQIIDALQPYNIPKGENPEIHKLWILHKLSNWDKHRIVTLNSGATETHFKAGMSHNWLNDVTVEISVPVMDKNLIPPPPEMKFYPILGNKIIGDGFQITAIEKIYDTIANEILPLFHRFFP